MVDSSEKGRLGAGKKGLTDPYKVITTYKLKVLGSFCIAG